MSHHDHDQLWLKIINHFQTLKPTKLVSSSQLTSCDHQLVGKKLVISGPKLTLQEIKDHLPLFQQAVNFVLKDNYQIDLVVNPFFSSQNQISNQKEISPFPFSNPIRIKKLNFHNLVIHKNNQKAVQVLNHFIHSDKQVCYLFGNPGTGKTHLSMAILEKYHQLYPQNSCYYLDSTSLISAYNQLVYQQGLDKELFVFNYTKFQFVVIDDLHKFNQKDQINNKLFSIIDLLLKNGSKILLVDLTSNREMKNLDESLRSRILSGFFAQITDIESEGMKMILIHYLTKENENLKFSSEAIDFLVTILPRDVRFACGFVDNLTFWLKQDQTALTIISKEKIIKVANEIGINQKIISNINNNPQQNKIKVFDLCQKLNLNYDDVMNPSRKRRYVEKRNTVIYLIKSCFGYTNETIGQMFNKHHSTITNCLNNVKKLTNLNKEYKRYLSQSKIRIVG